VLLSAEFQGFCRDLHDECAEKFVESVNPVALRDVLRLQCVHGRKLDSGNPIPANLGADFNRYQFNFWDEVALADPGHAARRARLEALNAWRNAIAHYNYDPANLGGATRLTIPDVRSWRLDCDAFAAAFDRVVREQLQLITGVSPWPP
jgi:hypothetical protein